MSRHLLLSFTFFHLLLLLQFLLGLATGVDHNKSPTATAGGVVVVDAKKLQLVDHLEAALLIAQQIALSADERGEHGEGSDHVGAAGSTTMENNGYTEEAEEEVGGGREGPDGFVWPADWRGQPRRLQQQQTTRDDAFTFVPDADGDDRLPHDDDVEEPAASAGQRGEDQQHQGSKQQAETVVVAIGGGAETAAGASTTALSSSNTDLLPSTTPPPSPPQPPETPATARNELVDDEEKNPPSSTQSATTLVAASSGRNEEEEEVAAAAAQVLAMPQPISPSLTTSSFTVVAPLSPPPAAATATFSPAAPPPSPSPVAPALSPVTAAGGELPQPSLATRTKTARIDAHAQAILRILYGGGGGATTSKADNFTANRTNTTLSQHPPAWHWVDNNTNNKSLRSNQAQRWRDGAYQSDDGANIVLIVALGLTLVAVVLLSAALVLGVYFYTQKLDRQEKHARLRRRGTAAGIFQWSTTNSTASSLAPANGSFTKRSASAAAAAGGGGGGPTKMKGGAMPVMGIGGNLNEDVTITRC